MDDETYALRAVSGGWLVGYQDEADTEYLIGVEGPESSARWTFFRQAAKVYPTLADAARALAQIIVREGRT